MTTFDPTRPVRTRDGRKARILCTDFIEHEGEETLIVAAVSYHGGGEHISQYDQSGYPIGAYGGKDDSLVNIRECWVVLRDDGVAFAFGTEADAQSFGDEQAHHNPIVHHVQVEG